MPWFENIIPDYIKKSVCTCLIKRYLSQFFENEIRRDQLNLDLYNGRGTVESISLAVEAINEMGESQNWPVEFVDGYIEKIDIIVPWTAILKDSAYVEITGLKLTVQPKQRNEDATSMFESMWNSMTSSMHIAEEFAKEEVASEKAQVFEGIEMFAQTIENIIGRVKIKFIDTVVQMEHVPKESTKGVGILINIDLLEYTDETGNDPPEETEESTNEESKKAYLINSFTTKMLSFEGVRLSTVEFSSSARTFSRSLIESRTSDHDLENSKDEIFFETTSGEERPSTKSSVDGLNSDNDRLIIMCGQITNKQQIKVKLKQSEDGVGPKVSMEVSLGFLNLFLSPRQFHIITELIEGFSTPSTEDTSNVAPRHNVTSKQMTEGDYRKIEEELQHMLNPFANFHTNLKGAHGWSSGPMDESSDSFLPMKDNSGDMYSSNISGVSSSMESSYTSSMASFATEQTQHTRRRGSNVDTDPTAEISRFEIRLSAVAVVLLHEDLLAGATSNDSILVKQMQNTAKEFFNKLNYVTYDITDFDNIRKAFDKACHYNQLRLFATPVDIEADEKTTSSSFSMTGNLTASKLELLECLYHNNRVNHIPILEFDTPFTTECPSLLKPSVKLKLKHVQKTGRSRLSKKRGPRTELNVSLNKCNLEFDISIIDRISTLINHPPICTKEEKSKWNQRNDQTHFANKPVADSTLDIKISSNLLYIKLLFPIPDFRPAHDLSKIHWWERNVRNDYLSLDLSDVLLSSMFSANSTSQEYIIESKTLDIYYYETEKSEGLHIGKAGSDEKYSSIQDLSSKIRLSIKLSPKEMMEDCEPIQDPMAHSCYGVLENQGRIHPGPFSAKRVVHESDTPHSKAHKGTSISHDSEELIIPGDKEEIDDFVKSTSSNTEMHVNIFLPTISAHLKSKHIYELLYNRINTDLLLWEPSAPKSNISVDPGLYAGNLFEGPDTYLMCKSGIQYESESESDESEETNVFYSTYDSKMRNSQGRSGMFRPKIGNQSSFVFNLKIGQGVLRLNPPVRDVATSNVIPGQQGEFLLNINDANVFVVSGYKGDENLGYVCVQIEKASLYHCDMQPEPSSSPPLREMGSAIGKNLHPTIYKSDTGALADCKNRGGKRQMFTVAVKIQTSHETHHVKTIQVSLGLNKATLRHKMCNEPNTWISHLLDFFNVQDYPISGYQAKEVLTEMHLHLWDCAIDYKPLHLPTHAVLSVGNFSLSSQLTATSNTSTLRFIFEECGLYLSEKTQKKNVDLKNDYVNVIDVGLFELSLRTNDKKTGQNPHIDLRAFNNKIVIRTCSDSGRALMELITYFANDGDLAPKEESEKQTENSFSSPIHDAETELLPVNQEIITVSKEQQEQVSEMLVEAIEDNDKPAEDDHVYMSTGARLFFFPDEKDVSQENQPTPFPQVVADLGDITYHVRNSDTDDEFCFVGNEPGLSLFPKDGVPEITWFTLDPVKINDNHFTIPSGKKDLLKPPKEFPTPVMRYTLCEMTVVWQMFGGSDFNVPESESSNKHVRFSEMQLNDTVTFSNTTSKVSINSSSSNKNENIEWKLRGGENRDHSLLMELELTKVRFQHEVYPENTEQASRQVLLISDVEIRDKLDINISKIHKFLYQFDSQDRPKKANSNMVVIKALHVRPDIKLKAQECCLKVSLLPLRLNIDQDALLFFINFFKELSGDNAENVAVEETTPETTSKQNTPTHQVPIMTITSENEEEIKQQAQKAVNENLMLLMEESRMMYEPEEVTSVSTDTISDETPIYFRKVVFSPTVYIRLDYNGKRVDMTHGPLAGLLMGLGQLKCSELKLKRIIYRHGLLGVSKLINYLLQEWLTDIKKNQLATILGGVGPMHAVLQVFQGVRDLFWLPIEQYQKDGRIIRGIQRGANSFTTLTAMAALELTTRLIYLIQLTAETAYDMLSPGPSIRMKRLAKIKGRKKRYHQPQDIREGFTNACLVVKEGFVEAADNIVQVAAMEKEQKGYSGAVGGVLRQLPPTIVKPVIIASDALTNVFGGLQSQLVPDARKEANQKWKTTES